MTTQAPPVIDYIGDLSALDDKIEARQQSMKLVVLRLLDDLDESDFVQAIADICQARADIVLNRLHHANVTKSYEAAVKRGDPV